MMLLAHITYAAIIVSFIAVAFLLNDGQKVLTCPVRRQSLQKVSRLKAQRHQDRMGGKLWRRQDAPRARRDALPARRDARWRALLARRDARRHALPARRHALPARRHALPARRDARWRALPARRDARWRALPARRRERKRRLHYQLLADQAKNPGLTRRGFFCRRKLLHRAPGTAVRRPEQTMALRRERRAR
jgi:hypothetical protein